MKRLLIQIVILISLSAVSLVARAQDRGRAALDDLDLRGSDCILIRTVRDYTPLDDRHLLIRGGAKRGYFVTLFRPAFDLRSSFRLGFSSRDDRLCPYGGDAIVTGDLTRERIPVRCISRVSEEQAEELMIRFGKKKPERESAPEPADVEGAEVEELG